MADGQVVFEITADGRHVKTDIKEITKAIQAEGKNWDKAAGSATGAIEDKFAGMTKSIVAKLTAAGIGAALLGWGADALEAASDLREVQNVVDTVFGDGAQQIENWSKKAGQQFGLTETQAKKFTSTLGAMMKSSGLAGNEIINMTTDLAGLAADMASFYNLDFETAFEKIRSGISGETMPLKQLGINMSAANLEAFALAQGLEKTFSQMDQGEQTMLRYQYLMQATADAQGDFEKTADGFANAQRRIQASLDTISTVAGGFILNTMEPLIGSVADFLAKITATPESTVLDDFNAIEVDTSQKMADLEETYQKAQAIIEILDEIGKQTVTLKDGSTITFEELFGDLGNIEAEGGDVRGYLESLGLNVEEVISKYNLWKESTRQLTSTVPTLTAVINTETCAIDGGTEAVKEYVDAWEQGQRKLIMLGELQKKESALETRFADLPGLELDKAVAEKRLRDRNKEYQELLDKYSLDKYDKMKAGSAKAVELGLSDAAVAELNAASDAFHEAEAEAINATNAYEKQKDALEEAKVALEEYRETIDEMPGEVEEATEAVEELTEEQIKAGREAVKATDEALKAIGDYVQGVRDSTEQTVNTVIKGFEKIEKAGDGLRQKQNDLAGEETEVLNKYSEVWDKWGSNNEALRKMAESQDNLTDSEREAYEALVKVRNAQKEVNDGLDQYKPQAMEAALESQIAYMEEYIDNLEKAQEMGLSDELLASLSDGSKESAEYLAGLVGDAEGAARVDEAFQRVAEKKKEFTDALASQKLSADEIYDGLVNKALDSIEALNLGGEAEAAMSDTVGGLAQGIQDRVGEVQAAVDSIEEQLNRLNEFGINFNFSDGLPWVSFAGLDGSFEMGLDRVPFDGFLAELHEGEGILTAEENRIWQRFKNGDASGRNSIDYDALGVSVGENVKAGGDVYLDGRTVGEVISGIQGRSYRNLQRSGWQK